MRVRLETRRSRVRPRRGRQHSFVEIDHEIFSTVILSLPLIQEGQLSVSGERMCTILVNRLEDLACHAVNVWLGKLTALDMTELGWLGRKTTTQTNKPWSFRSARATCTGYRHNKMKHVKYGTCTTWTSSLYLFVCVDVLRPSHPYEVMSSAVSLSNHTFIGQTVLLAVNQYCAHSFARNWLFPFLNQRKGENDRRKVIMINLHERISATRGGRTLNLPITSGTCIQLATEAGYFASLRKHAYSNILKILPPKEWKF